MRTTSATFEFSIVVSGIDPFASDFDNRFFEAACADATISFQRGAIMLAFSRKAASFDAAVASALADIARVGADLERAVVRA